jgi:diacylglycerol kinase (ATP)
MTSVAVIAHRKKSLGGGLPELRRLLADRGVVDPIWYEVGKSRKAPGVAKQAVADGADLLLLWGGDGTVQRSIDAVAGSAVTIGIIPAGTANLLARNLGIPADLAAAVDLALEGPRRTLDLGVINGERFAVMAGAGFDAIMMKASKGGIKDRFGQLAYVWTGTRATLAEPVKMSIQVDGADWLKAKASCLLLGNMGTLTGGLTAFPDALPDDGLLEVGVVTAHGPIQWARVLALLLRGRPDRSKLVHATRGRQVDVKFAHAVPYELDGGARRATRRLRSCIEPQAITMAAPRDPGRPGKRSRGGRRR